MRLQEKSLELLREIKTRLNEDEKFTGALYNKCVHAMLSTLNKDWTTDSGESGIPEQSLGYASTKTALVAWDKVFNDHSWNDILPRLQECADLSVLISHDITGMLGSSMAFHMDQETRTLKAEEFGHVVASVAHATCFDFDPRSYRDQVLDEQRHLPDCPSLEELQHIQANYNREQLEELGLEKWNSESEDFPEEDRLYVFPAKWYDQIPRGTEVVSILGKKSNWDPDNPLDGDMRGGILSYGIICEKG